jgi:hypothetical protein
MRETVQGGAPCHREGGRREGGSWFSPATSNSSREASADVRRRIPSILAVLREIREKEAREEGLGFER